MKLIIPLLVLIIFLSGCGSPPDCKEYSVDECPSECVVCPPCEVCSSISCQTPEFCRSIGFEKEWYDDMKTRIVNKG